MRLLKFEADWCGPCAQQESLLEDYDATPVEHIDVDESHENQERANKYNVRSLPTMILLDDSGEVIDQFVGLTQPDEIEDAI